MIWSRLWRRFDGVNLSMRNVLHVLLCKIKGEIFMKRKILFMVILFAGFLGMWKNCVRAYAEDKVFSCGNYAIYAGDYIITSDKNGIKARSVTDNTERVIVYEDDFFAGSIASDGTTVYYTSSGSGINRIGIDGRNHIVVTETGKAPKFLAGIGNYLYYTDEIEGEEYAEQRLHIYDVSQNKEINYISNVDNVIISGERIYYHIVRYEPEPVSFYSATLKGKKKKLITKKFCDGVVLDEEIYYLEYDANRRLRLVKCGFLGENKEKPGKKFDADLIIYMGNDYIYYIRTKDGNNSFYVYRINDGTQTVLNSTTGYYSAVESDEEILYLRNTKTGLFFLLDGTNFIPTHTTIKGNLNLLGLYHGYIYYSKLDKDGKIEVKRKVLKS